MKRILTLFIFALAFIKVNAGIFTKQTGQISFLGRFVDVFCHLTIGPDSLQRNSDRNIHSITRSINCPDTIHYGGQSYNIITINGRCWFKENLNIGTRINGNLYQGYTPPYNVPGEIYKFCYNDDEQNCNIYGGLYQFNHMMLNNFVEKTQGICPVGWHIPSNDEFTDLLEYLGGDSLAGGAMKSTGTLYWTYPNTDGTNSSGFSVLPAGYHQYNNGCDDSRYISSLYGSLHDFASFWTSTRYEQQEATVYIYEYVGFNYHSGFARQNSIRIFWTYGFSVRCIKDEGLGR